jgi:hypothetical protein
LASAAGPPAKRPLRAVTELDFFLPIGTTPTLPSIAPKVTPRMADGSRAVLWV